MGLTCLQTRSGTFHKLIPFPSFPPYPFLPLHLLLPFSALLYTIYSYRQTTPDTAAQQESHNHHHHHHHDHHEPTGSQSNMQAQLTMGTGISGGHDRPGDGNRRNDRRPYYNNNRIEKVGSHIQNG